MSIPADPSSFVLTSENPLKSWDKCVAVGRAHDLLRDDLLSHLDWIQKEVGFRSCRFHAIFHDDVGVVKKTADGKIRYCWNQVDKIYDALLQRGLRPFVELNSMPSALASGAETMFDYRMNVTPPARWEEWSNLVEAFARHLLNRYGAAEVQQWNFEVWNEPNLPAFWSGSKEDYFHLYEISARALRRVDERLQVGGPASSKAHWITDLISYCHQNRVPLDFISTHLYPQDEQVEADTESCSPERLPGTFFGEIFHRVRKEVAASQMPHLKIHWTEWNPQSAKDSASVTWVDNESCDNAYGGAFVVRQCLELNETCDSMAFWVASDVFMEHPMQPAPFSATYGMLTIDGVPKATANAFRFLRRMRGDICARVNHAPSGCGGIATRDADAIHVLVYNCQPPTTDQTFRWKTEFRLPCDWKEVVLTEMKVSLGQGSAYEWWCELGRPLHLSSAQMAAMRQAAEPVGNVRRISTADGHCHLTLDLAANSFAYFEIRPVEEAAPKKSEWVDVHNIEAELSQLSRG